MKYILLVGIALLFGSCSREIVVKDPEPIVKIKRPTLYYLAENTSDKSIREISQPDYDGYSCYNDNEPVHVNDKFIIVPMAPGMQEYRIIKQVGTR